MVNNKFLIFGIIVLICIVNVNAVYIEDNSSMHNMDHAIRIKNVSTNPEYISPGSSGILTFVLEDSSDKPLDDVIAVLGLPSQFKFIEEVNKIKISRLEPGEEKEFQFKIVADPSADEGIYNATLDLNYVSYFGLNYVNVGEEKSDSYILGLSIKSIPKIFVKVDSTEVYKGNDLGNIRVNFVNNGLGNIRFLTVELMESDNYKILSSNKEYIGDLDSDDFESVEFKINLLKDKELKIPLKIHYRDALGEEYEEELLLPFEVLSAKEAGISSNAAPMTIFLVIILSGVGYYFYKKQIKKRKNKL